MEQLQSAVDQELTRRNTNLLNGIFRYQTHPFSRPNSTAKTIWQNGNTALLDFGAALKKPKATVLFVPSLINRYYILDLMEGRSFVSHLAEQNIRALVVDWGNPNEEEADFDCADYISKRLEPALCEAAKLGAPVFLAGYCMGGLLALGLAQTTQTKLAGLALLAMPWDFHAQSFSRVKLGSDHISKLETLIAKNPTLPGDVLQTLFYATNPWVFARKFANFSKLETESEEAEEFVAMESWVNDTVPMAAPVARECLIDWVQQNKPACGEWRIDGEVIDPAVLDLPIFAACPTHDTVVPPDSAQAALPKLENATIIRPISGHTGMVAGANAARELWHPFSAWIHAAL